MVDDEELEDDFQDGEGPDVDDLDDEMKSLIEQLDNEDDVSQKIEGDTSPPLELTPTIGEKPAESFRETPAAETLVPQDVRKLDLTFKKTEAEVITAPPEPPIVDLRKQFQQMDEMNEEILQAARADRQEVQDVINVYKNEIDKAVAANAVPSRGYLDNIVKALEVKATVNMTAIKAMEVKVKMLAATKAGVSVNVQNNNVANAQAGSTDPGLIDLLNENPLQASGEDEY